MGPPRRRARSSRLETAESWWPFMLRVASGVVGVRIAWDFGFAHFGVEDVPLVVFAAGCLGLPIANVLAGMREEATGDEHA